jgi:alkaline phosphatase
MLMRRLLLITLVCASSVLVSRAQVAGGGATQARPAAAPMPAPPERATNVILFIGDAGGVPTLNAASLYGYDRPQALFIQHMPFIALMDTSAANNWVTDSAAGMTAIVTGRKTNSGVLSQSADAVRGAKDGAPLKTILEYAEEHGLSTGVITNDSVAGATPAACFAHTNNRNDTASIMSQLARPSAGDGVDLVLGGGRSDIYKAAAAAGLQLDAMLRARGYRLLDSPEAIRPDMTRAVGMAEPADYDLSATVAAAVAALSRNPKGYFLMVEWDLHTDDPKKGLDRTLVLDRVIRETAGKADPRTLVIFAADHSFDIRLRGGGRGRPLFPEWTLAAALSGNPPLRVDDGHTGEEVLVAAQGPGARRVHGFIANTDLFRIMMAAYGWTETVAAR